MANTIKTDIIHDGERKVIVNVVITGDGSGDEAATTIVAKANLTGTFDELKLIGIKAQLSSFAAQLLWDADANVAFESIPADTSVDQDYRSFGGKINTAGFGKTGDILLTTVGLGNGDHGSIVLEMRKRGG